MQKILVIEDETSIAETIAYALKSEGFDPVWCDTGAQGLQLLARETFSLIVLDIGLPDVNGLELCKTIRRTSPIPIVFLTARADEIDRIVGLEIGADDYIVKPFSPRELSARIKAILRRSGEFRFPATLDPPSPASMTAESDPFRIDEARRQIIYFGAPLELTRCEFQLLTVLIKHPGRVFSREELKAHAWEDPEFSLDRSVDSHIKSVRAKLRAIKPDLDIIETRRGFGYALKVL